MNHSVRLVFALCALIAIAAAALVGSIVGQAQGREPVLYLKSTQFTPSRGERPALPPGLVIAGYAQNQRGYYIVQFSGPIEQAWKDSLAAAGAEILEYIPDFAFKTRMTPAESRAAERLEHVIYVDVFQPAYKLSPDLIRNGTRVYAVRIERGADYGLATAAVVSTGAQVLSRDEGILVIAADTNQLEAVARVLDVAWIQNFTMPQRHNEFAGGVIIGANAANLAGYDGSTQTVAVADTGLGGGTAETAHADIGSGRVTAIFNWPGAAGGCFSSVSDDGAVDVSSGHGTHTAVSAVGAALLLGRGTAPRANLVFQAVENYVTISWICSFVYGYANGYYLTGLPGDLNQLYLQAYNAGARIHSNSWGAAVAGDYDLNSANTDAFVWNHRDMLITFSAGNEGWDANSDGIIDNDSMASPGTAKNVITVGASENHRQGNYPCDTSLTYTDCLSLGGKNDDIIVTYGVGWGFPANPIKDDRSEGNPDQMAAFSSRGPTDDGRIKPDVVAPGTYVLSGYSEKYQQQYDPAPNPVDGNYQYDGWAYPESDKYKYLGGTSMSNPLVAGGAAVVRDYYQKEHDVAASAALVKATIINSAVDLPDENNDGVGDNDYPIPNSHEGWGRVNLAAATDGAGKFRDNMAGVGTNGTATYTAAAAAGPLKVTLVWSDYPSTESAAVNLVNDLDLRVTAPGGAIYQGNIFSGGWSQTGGSPDRRNNVENVYIQAAVTAGNYVIEVRGYNVPYGPQPFALVVRGASLTDGLPGLIDPEVTFTGAPAFAAYLTTFIVNSSTNSSSLPVFTASGPCEVSGTASNSATYMMTGGTGTCTSIVTWAPDNEYNGATQTQTTTAEKIHPTVTFTGAPPTAANYSSFTVASTTNSSSTPVYTSSGACTNSGAVYTMTANSGTCTSTATWAADNNFNGATRSRTTVAEPGDPPAKTVHVGNLTGTSSSGSSYWVAGVSTFVEDANHNPVGGAKVTATWSSGTKSSGSCTTTKGGYCTITSGRISNTSANVIFTVTKITKSGYTYDPMANHDSAGDSNGTTMEVKKP